MIHRLIRILTLEQNVKMTDFVFFFFITNIENTKMFLRINLIVISFIRETDI